MAEKMIDCTPTWRALVPALAYCAMNGETSEAREGAMRELLRLADIGDRAVAERRADERAERCEER